MADNLGEFTNFKVNPESIKIDPALGVSIASSGPANVPPPDDQSLEPHVGASVAMMGRPQRVGRTIRKGPGSTLAEQFGVQDGPAKLGERITPKISIATPSTFFDARSTQAPQLQDIRVPLVNPKHVETEVVRKEPPKIDLKSLVLNTIEKLGEEEACAYFEVPKTTIARWKKDVVPLWALQKVMDDSPKARQTFLQITETIDWIDSDTRTFSVEHTKEELPVDLCLSVKGSIDFYAWWPWTVSTLKYGIGIKAVPETILERSRNLVAAIFLRGTAQYSVWVDSDVVPTIGDAGWYKATMRPTGVSEKTLSYYFVTRLLSHKKPYVGGVYSTRRKDGPLVIQPDLHPRNQKDREISELIRKNAAQGLYEVDWLNQGLCCIHRSVFEDVRKRHPEREPKNPKEPYPFFSTLDNSGEDKAFSELAREAGYKLYLDTELFAAHIGKYAFMPSESKYNGPVEITV